MVNPSGDLYVKQAIKEVKLVSFVRSDIKDAEGKILELTQSPVECKEEFVEDGFGYDDEIFYDEGPEDVECPYEGITGCKSYHNSTDKISYVLDSEEHMVYSQEDDGNMNITIKYLTDEVKPEDFVFQRCDGTETPVPVDFCNAPSSSSAAPSSSSAAPSSSSAAPAPSSITPKLDCAGHMTTVTTELDLITGEIVVMDQDVLYMANPAGDLYVKQTMFEGNLTIFVRSDIKDASGKVLSLMNYNNETGNCKEVYIKEDEAQFFYNQEIFYDQGPMDSPCPYEGITGCKLYYNSTEGMFYVLDSERHVVFESIRGLANSTMKYLKDEVKAEDFVFDRCDGNKTSVPVDFCKAPSGSSSAGPKSSSASVKAAVAVVAAALLIALF